MSNRTRIAAVVLTTSLLATAAARADDPARTAFRIARDAGCVICHNVERSANGYLPNAPAFEDVACRYRADPDAADRLSSIVRNGSGPLRRDRHWTGKVAFDTMYPNDLMVTDAQTHQIVDWILTLCPKSAERRRSRR
jgi:cytochrome c